MPTTTPRLGLPKGNGADNARDYLKGAIAGGGLWHALEVLDDALLQSSVNTLDNVTLTSPNIGADQWTDANHTHASAATAGSTLGPGTTLSTPTLTTPAVSGVMTFGGDATLSRTGAGALRADTHLGVGVNPAPFGSAWRAVQVGQAAALWGQAAGRNTLLVDNSYQDDVGPKAIVTGPASRVQLFNDGVAVATAPSVAAGAAQTFTTRAQVGPTGTLTLTPDAGANVLMAAVNGQANHFQVVPGAVNPSHACIYANLNLELRPGTGHVMPHADRGFNLGHSSYRVDTVYAFAGTINTSSAAAKEGITPLDPARAMEAVRATEAVTFDYRPPERGPEWYDLPDDPEQAEQVLAQRLTAAPLEAAARHQSGFVAEDCDPLFLVGEGQTSPGNSVGVLLAALQNLDSRLAALETP